MMKSIKSSFIVLLPALFFISCSNDDGGAPYEVRENRITKEISANTTKTFSYNANNQLTKIIELGDLNFGTTQSVENYTYSADGKVTEVTADYTGSSAFGFRYNYFYGADGKISTVTIKRYLGSGTYDPFSQLFFEYDANGVRRYEYRQDGTTTATIYEVVNGNTTSYSVYTGITANTPNGQLSYTNVLSNYDDKKTPYAGLPLVYKEPYLYKNNPRQSQSSGSTVNYTYEYNDDGYPTKKITAFNSTTTTITYVYERI